MSELPVHCQVCGLSYRVDSVNLADILEVIAAVFTVAVRCILCHRIVTIVEERVKTRDFVRSQWCGASADAEWQSAVLSRTTCTAK